MKKKIGISLTSTNFQNYLNWFTQDDLNDDLELKVLSFLENNVADIETCSGFVLTGGIDIEPGLYGESSNYSNGPDVYQQDRDLFEEKIYRYAAAKSLPVIGICRGMQLINVLEGGKLIQDLGEQGNKVHRKIDIDKQHAVTIDENSLLFEIAGEKSGLVNSAHHQGVDKNVLSDQLQANAFSDNLVNIIEGLEFKDKTNKPFMVCVQWHPERIINKETNPLSQNIKERFLSEIRKIITK